MQEKLKLNYWGNISKTHVSLHSNDGIHTEISPPNADPSSQLLRNWINKEEEEKKISNGLLHPEPAMTCNNLRNTQFFRDAQSQTEAATGIG